MSNTQPCGHDTRYIVQADEGTAYCFACYVISEAGILGKAAVNPEISDAEMNTIEQRISELTKKLNVLYWKGEREKQGEAA